MAASKRFYKECFLCESVSVYDKNVVKSGLFQVPVRKVDEWQSVITKPGLKSTSKLCHRHFDDEDILKGRTIQNVFYPHSKWMLKKEAKPKYFLGKYLRNF